MIYPTLIEVEKANQIQLARWYRFLNSPGWSATGLDSDSFEHAMRQEKEIMDRIIVRFTEMGGFNSSISKHIGWEV